MLKFENKLYLLSFFNGLVFYAPVALLVRTNVGISLSQVFLLQFILSLTALLFEVPSGAMSDKMGYKRTIVATQAMLLIARLVLLCAGEFWLFVIEAIIEGISFAMESGNFSAYLYAFKQGENYALLSSRMGRWGSAGFIISTLLFPLINSFGGISLLVAATCLASVISLLISVSLPAEQEHPTTTAHETTIGIDRIWLKFFLMSAMISISYLIVNFFYADKTSRIGLDDSHLSIIIILYSALRMLTPQIISRIRLKHYALAVKASLPVCGVLFLSLYILEGFTAVIPMLLIPSVLDINAYLLDELINEEIDTRGLSVKRAAALSAVNLGSSALEMAFLLLSAGFPGNEGNLAFLLIGLFFLSSTLPIILISVTKRR